MKFDWDLIEKIGATHYSDCSDVLYRVRGNVEFYSGGWKLNQNNDSWCVAHLKPIPPRPQPEYEFVKCEFEKASDAIIAWENEELFATCDDKNYHKIKTAQDALRYMYRAYKKVEKPKPDWIDKLGKFFEIGLSCHAIDEPYVCITDAGVTIDGGISRDDFLEMCKLVYLTAKESGEID